MPTVSCRGERARELFVNKGYSKRNNTQWTVSGSQVRKEKKIAHILIMNSDIG